MDNYNSIISKLPASNFIFSGPLSTPSSSDGDDDVDVMEISVVMVFPFSSAHCTPSKIAYITSCNSFSVYKYYCANLTVMDNKARGG